jgi:hypothetical protein
VATTFEGCVAQPEMILAIIEKMIDFESGCIQAPYI